MNRILAVIGVVLSSLLAHATTIFDYPNFSSTAGLTLSGIATTNGSNLQLTPSTTFQSGAAYSSNVVTLGANDAFSTTFQFQFSNPVDNYSDSSPADGIAFSIDLPPCTTPSTCPPTAGFGNGGLGYMQNTTQLSFGVAFVAGQRGVQGESIVGNHVATLGNYSTTETNVTNPYGVSNCGFGSAYLSAGCMANGDVWTANIIYDGSNLTVKLFDPAEGATTTVLNAVPVNIMSDLCSGWPSYQGPCPGTNVFVGLTGSTGGNAEAQDILSWTLTDGASQGTSAPEPSSALLLAGGLLALAYRTVSARRIARWKLCRPVSRNVTDTSVC
jgi:hypothetical protein